MSESSKENPPRHESKTERSAIFSLMDFRMGHWPGSKTPPWLFTEMAKAKYPEWDRVIEEKNWDKVKELFVGSGCIEIDGETHELDIYALPPRSGSDYVSCAAYPKGKSHSDFWDEAGERIEAEDE